MKSDEKRIIKPYDGRFVILWKLRRFNESIVVYDINNPDENRSYSRVHCLFDDLIQRRLVNYGRNPREFNEIMYASITINGRDWIKRKIAWVVGYIFTTLAGIYALIKLIQLILIGKG